MKKIITCTTEGIELGSYKTDFGALLLKLRDLEKEIPLESEISGYVSGYDDEYYTLEFTYQREETDSEYEERLRKEKIEKKRIDDDEKEMYRRLKEKFE